MIDLIGNIAIILQTGMDWMLNQTISDNYENIEQIIILFLQNFDKHISSKKIVSILQKKLVKNCPNFFLKKNLV
jgi:hypothetical protein